MNPSPGPDNMDRLRQHLDRLPQGPIAEPREVEDLLRDTWDAFGGDDGGMHAGKLMGRTENMSWDPPCLTFDIERHGAQCWGHQGLSFNIGV